MSVKEIDVIRFWSPRNGAAMTDERFEALRHELRPDSRGHRQAVRRPKLRRLDHTTVDC